MAKVLEKNKSIFPLNCNCYCNSIEYSDHSVSCPIWINGVEERKSKQLNAGSYLNPYIWEFFDENYALSELLRADIIFINCYHWEKEAPKWVQDAIAICVNINDLFVPAADAEHLPYDQLESLYKMWKYDPLNGITVWASLRRRHFPKFNKGNFNGILKDSLWQLDKLNLDKDLIIDKNITNEQLKEWIELHIGKLENG